MAKRGPLCTGCEILTLACASDAHVHAEETKGHSFKLPLHCTGRKVEPKADACLLHPLQLLVPRPHLFSGRAKHLEDLVNLVDLRVALEEDLLSQQLGHDATQRPDVDGCGVLLGTCVSQGLASLA